CALYPLSIARCFHEFDTRAAEFRTIVQKLPYDPNVLTIAFPPREDPALPYMDVWRQFHAYVLVERGGFDPWSWPDGFPMRTRPEAMKPAPPDQHPEQLDPASLAAYDWLLFRNAPMEPNGFTLIARDG